MLEKRSHAPARIEPCSVESTQNKIEQAGEPQNVVARCPRLRISTPKARLRTTTRRGPRPGGERRGPLVAPRLARRGRPATEPRTTAFGFRSVERAAPRATSVVRREATTCPRLPEAAGPGHWRCGIPRQGAAKWCTTAQRTTMAAVDSKKSFALVVGRGWRHRGHCVLPVRCSNSWGCS